MRASPPGHVAAGRFARPQLRSFGQNGKSTSLFESVSKPIPGKGSRLPAWPCDNGRAHYHSAEIGMDLPANPAKTMAGPAGIMRLRRLFRVDLQVRPGIPIPDRVIRELRKAILARVRVPAGVCDHVAALLVFPDRGKALDDAGSRREVGERLLQRKAE